MASEFGGEGTCGAAGRPLGRSGAELSSDVFLDLRTEPFLNVESIVPNYTWAHLDITTAPIGTAAGAGDGDVDEARLAGERLAIHRPDQFVQLLTLEIDVVGALWLVVPVDKVGDHHPVSLLISHRHAHVRGRSGILVRHRPHSHVKITCYDKSFRLMIFYKEVFDIFRFRSHRRFYDIFWT